MRSPLLVSPRTAAQHGFLSGLALGVLICVAGILLKALPFGIPLKSLIGPLMILVTVLAAVASALAYVLQRVVALRVGDPANVEGFVGIRGRPPSPYAQLAKFGSDHLSHRIAAHLYEDRRLTRVSGCVLDSSHAVQLEGLEEVARFRTARAPELIAIDCWMGWPRKQVFEAEFLFVCRTQEGRGLAMYLGVHRNRSELDFIRAFPTVEEALAFAGSSDVR